MNEFDRARGLVEQIRAAGTEAELAETLTAVARELGFAYFALTHHVDVRRHPRRAIRLNNYPGEWVAHYDANCLGVTDPVHRAAHVTSVGFAWSQIPRMIALTGSDREILARGARSGIGDGFTVPANVPGESRGSCSFANPAGVSLQDAHLPAAQLVGQFAFDAARRLWRVRPPRLEPPLTDRQRECLKWAALGKTDWEIGAILGIARGTVILHLKHARERYGGCNRTLTVVHALNESTLTFPDIFGG